MRWSIIRLIWMRELRDQLRDRRTLFMIAVLPILLYPIAGFGLMQLAVGYLTPKSSVGIAGVKNLHPWQQSPPIPTPVAVASLLAATAPLPGPMPPGIDRLGTVFSLALARGEVERTGRTVGWLAMTPPLPGCPAGGIERLGCAAAFCLARAPLDYPPLLEEHGRRLRFSPRYLEAGGKSDTLLLRPIPGAVPASNDPEVLLGHYRSLLDERKLDLVMVAPARFQDSLVAGGQPELFLFSREKDESARIKALRVRGILNRWRGDLRETRLARLGLPSDFDQTVRVYDSQQAKTFARVEEENLFNILVRVFPFVLVMWSLAGALYPAIDLCAGEKERGTMETLLISPASREEIVWGKFLTIWLFSAATALLNLVSMGLTTWRLSAAGPQPAFRIGALLWGLLLLLPLSAFFSALCLSVGAYARSSKEGQYYLMPLFFFTMPLIFLTLAPGVELNSFYSMVPVTGVALLLQKLMAEKPGWGVGLYFVPVLAPMVIYSWLALRWAIGQFQREEVLFREAERIDIGLWLKRLLRDKEALPTAGEAFFCFFLILGLHWMSLSVGKHLPLLTRTGIGYLAFVATPPLFMALLLTTRPMRSLALVRPAWWSLPAAGLFALLALLPLAELTLAVINQFPVVKNLLEENQPLMRELLSREGKGRSAWEFFLVLAVLSAFCEEVAFRGLILCGLLRSFRPWTAILLSAFFSSLYQMNVFQFLPHFVLGIVLGILVVRGGSVLPAMFFHLIYNSLLIGLSGLDLSEGGALQGGSLRWGLSAACAVLVVGGLVAVWRLGQPPVTAAEPGGVSA